MVDKAASKRCLIDGVEERAQVREEIALLLRTVRHAQSTIEPFRR